MSPDRSHPGSRGVGERLADIGRAREELLRRLELVPAEFGGIAVASLRTEVCEWVRVIESGTDSIRADFPQIRPIDPQPE